MREKEKLNVYLILFHFLKILVSFSCAVHYLSNIVNSRQNCLYSINHWEKRKKYIYRSEHKHFLKTIWHMRILQSKIQRLI